MSWGTFHAVFLSILCFLKIFSNKSDRIQSSEFLLHKKHTTFLCLKLFARNFDLVPLRKALRTASRLYQGFYKVWRLIFEPTFAWRNNAQLRKVTSQSRPSKLQCSKFIQSFLALFWLFSRKRTHMPLTSECDRRQSRSFLMCKSRCWYYLY